MFYVSDGDDDGGDYAGSDSYCACRGGGDTMGHRQFSSATTTASILSRGTVSIEDMGLPQVDGVHQNRRVCSEKELLVNICG